MLMMGKKPFEMAKKTEYDIVLLDVMLPKMDGFEVVRGFGVFQYANHHAHWQRVMTWIRFSD